MSKPAVDLRAWGILIPLIDDVPTAVELADDTTLHLIGSASEPASEGEPPVLPRLVEQVDLGFSVRSARSRSGELTTSSTDTDVRPLFRLTWDAIDAAEYALMRDFFRPATVRGRRFAFDVRPNGDGEPIATMRATEIPRFAYVRRNVFRIEPFTAELVLA